MVLCTMPPQVPLTFTLNVPVGTPPPTAAPRPVMLLRHNTVPRHHGLTLSTPPPVAATASALITAAENFYAFHAVTDPFHTVAVCTSDFLASTVVSFPFWQPDVWHQLTSPSTGVCFMVHARLPCTVIAGVTGAQNQELVVEVSAFVAAWLLGDLFDGDRGSLPRNSAAYEQEFVNLQATLNSRHLQIQNIAAFPNLVRALLVALHYKHVDRPHWLTSLLPAAAFDAMLANISGFGLPQARRYWPERTAPAAYGCRACGTDGVVCLVGGSHTGCLRCFRQGWECVYKSVRVIALFPNFVLRFPDRSRSWRS